jgi:hypothetical protein
VGFFRLELTDKQKEAVKVISENKITLLEGGGRSGKTMLTLYCILLRALKVTSTHLIARFRFSHAKQSICFQTMPKLIKILGLQNEVILNKSDWYYQCKTNGSTIWIAGLDDKERTEKMLGNEYATIFLNEGSQISYDPYEMITTRLNPPVGLKGKIIVDYNPPSISHWGYKMFHLRRFPDGRDVPENDYGKIQMNPKDNKFISKEYLETLSLLSASKRQRFEHGAYSLDNGSLWKRGWIKYGGELEELWRVVVGVDPSGTVDGDEVGIVVAGMKDGEYVVLDDYSMNGTPAEWSRAVAEAYVKWNADLVVAEKNYGGDMVEATIKSAEPTLNVKLINSSRSKILRAEPVSALYEHGKVSHRIPFLNLEDEMCMYEPGSAQSPNRLDASVFVLTELSGCGMSMLDVI